MQGIESLGITEEQLASILSAACGEDREYLTGPEWMTSLHLGRRRWNRLFDAMTEQGRIDTKIVHRKNRAGLTSVIPAYRIRCGE